MRVEGVAPRDPVVAVADLVQAHVVALRRALAERAVVGAGSPRPCRRSSTIGIGALGPVAVDAADEARDPLVAREARSCLSSAGGRSCPTGGRARRSVSGWRRCACSIASAPRLAPSPIRTGRGAGARGQHLVGERARRSAPRRSTISLRSTGPISAARSGGSCREKRQQRRVLGVLRPVVGDEQRAALRRLGMRPDQRGQIGLEDPARDRDRLRLADRLRPRPTRRLVAGLLPHRLVPPWPDLPSSGSPGRAPTRCGRAVDQLELVLEACDVGCGRGQLPDCVPFRVSSCGSRSRSWWARRTAARATAWIGDWKRISITGVCRLCGNWRAEPSFGPVSGRFGH